MGCNFYRIPKLTDEVREEIKDIADTAKGSNELLTSLEALMESKCKAVHIGKSSIGWKFHWDAFVLDDILSQHPEIKDRELPVGDPLYDEDDKFVQPRGCSYIDFNSDDMKKVTKADIEEWLASGEIFDEYDKRIEPAEIWGMVESKKDGLDSKKYQEKYQEDTPMQVYVDGLFFNGWVTEWC